MIKVNFTFCALFKTLCVFFCSERKVSQGCQNHKLSVQRKNLFRIFLTQMLFQNVFWFREEELAVLAKITRIVVIFTFYGSEGTFPEQHFLKQLCKYFNFLGVLVKIPWQQSSIIFIIDETAKSVSRNKLRKYFFHEKKNYFNFFKNLSEVFFCY